METEAPVGMIMGASLIAGLLLLLAPWTPPLVALIGFVAIFVIGVTIFFAIGFVSELTISTADRMLPELPEEEEEAISDDTIAAYMDGRISEQELEEAIEYELENKER